MKGKLIGVLVFLLAVTLLLCSTAFAYEKSGDFEYQILADGTVKIRNYNGTDTELVIPDTIDGYTVSALDEGFSLTNSVGAITSLTIPDSLTVIECGAFSNASALTDIRISKNHPTLVFIDGVLYNKPNKSVLCYLRSNAAEHFDVPDGIRAIEDEAFSGAKNLVSVTLPGSVESIGYEGFNWCSKLTDITLSEGLLTIERGAFVNCHSLERIVIPASVTDISEFNFIDHKMKEILVDPANPVFTVVDGALINTRDGVLLAYPEKREAETCTVPDGVKRIATYAFCQADMLKEIILPDGLLELGNYAFADCDQLTALDLPESLIKIEQNVFDGCKQIQSFTIPAFMTEIEWNYNNLDITELIIPETVTSMKDSFNSLNNLTEVVIPDSVTSIGSQCFTYCKNLSSITIPASVTEIANIQYVFNNCAETLVFKVEPGSYAEQYCKDNQLNYELISNEAETEEDPFAWLNSPDE